MPGNPTVGYQALAGERVPLLVPFLEPVMVPEMGPNPIPVLGTRIDSGIRDGGSRHRGCSAGLLCIRRLDPRLSRNAFSFL